MPEFDEVTQEEYEAMEAELDEYIHGMRRKIYISSSPEVEVIACEYCGSGWHESDTRPGTCGNCGAPEPKVELFPPEPIMRYLR